MTLVYLTLEQAIETHERSIVVSGGGLLGQRHMGQLDSILTHIQNDNYYPAFIEKLTHLFFSTARSQMFVDGNKRLGPAHQ